MSVRMWLVGLAGLVLLLGGRQLHGESISVGDILAADSNQKAIIRVDPATGDRSVVSDNSTGTGPSFGNFGGIAVDSQGFILVTDQTNGVVRIDPLTGNRMVVSGGSIGSGPSFSTFLSGISVAANGDLLVADSLPNTLFRVDATTGDRSVVSSNSVGSGPAFGSSSPRGVAVDDAAGDAFATDISNDVLLRIDLDTGDRSIASGATVGTGPAFGNVISMARESTGSLLVTDNGLNEVLRVDSTTGSRTVLTTGSGPFFRNPWSLALEADGNILFSGNANPPGVADIAIYRLNPSTGGYSLVSSNTVGTGSQFQNNPFLAVVQIVPNSVPTPSTLVALLGMGLMATLGYRRRRNRAA